MKQVSLLLLFAFTVAIPQAKADFLLEPYIGYMLGKANPGSDDVSGAEYGLRMGYQGSGGFQAGGEYMTGNLTEKSGGTSSSFSPNNIGFFLGYNFQGTVRIWGTYFFSAQDKFDSSDRSGNAVKIGVGFELAKVVELNLEYFNGTYNEFNGKSGSTVTDQLFGVSVSFPLLF